MPNQSLMIKTKNKKKYYTDLENLPMLVEFAKTFGAELSVIESPDVQSIGLDLLAPALCDDSYESPQTERKPIIVRKIYPLEPNVSHTRQEMLQNAKIIRDYIKSVLDSKGIIKISEIKEKFRNLHLTDSCISNHMAVVIKDFEQFGKKINRLRIGVYEVEKQSI